MELSPYWSIANLWSSLAKFDLLVIKRRARKVLIDNFKTDILENYILYVSFYVTVAT